MTRLLVSLLFLTISVAAMATPASAQVVSATVKINGMI